MNVPAALPHFLFGLSDTQVEAIATVVIAVLTLAYVIVASFQLRAMRAALKETSKSNDATQESNEIAERALVLGRRSWLDAFAPNLPSTRIARGEFITRSDLRVRNVGSIPALIQRFGCAFTSESLPERLSLTAEQSTACAIILCAGDSELLERVWAEPEPVVDDRRRELFFWWIVEYSDCFEKTWRTMRCWHRVSGRGAEWGKWEPVPGYNILQ